MEEFKNDLIIEIYPNPANELITVSLNGSFDNNCIIQLLDLSGKPIIQEYLDYSVLAKHKIDISSLNRGIYILRIKTNFKSAVHKIIKY